MKVFLQNPSAWALIASYLDKALDLEPGEREIWLNDLTATQSEVAHTLRELLSERDALNAQGFMNGSPLLDTRLDTLMPTLEELLQQRAGVESSDWPKFAAELLTGVSEGAVVGAYRLLREIGHGGMSSVWLADRCDGQLKREVALKLPFVGPQRTRLAERFQRERDILARLTHPNIARIYDAGISASGQLYLAMEYVEGVSLIQYCDARFLSLRERLQVFLQALAAVQFAHAHLVIHRDLKPSNILVTPQGRVVLLDFGIAKLLGEDTGNESQLTQMTGRALTPDYASPEQIAAQPLGTASDVYSLGVVLYELLTGERPYRPKRESRAALEEAILTRDPQRPSQIVLSEAQATVRGSIPRRLSTTLKGDIDTIVLKALKKSPSDRYGSVDAFAQDIGNYLHSMPVGARPDSWWYRFGRFVARYKLPVTAAALILLAIVSGAALAIWQARVAAGERDRAFALATRNEAINGFTEMLITEAAASAKPVTVSDMLVRSEKLALADTHGDAEDRAAILGMIAGRYNTLGDAGKSAQAFERALALVGDSPDSSLRSRLVCGHALATATQGQVEIALGAITRELDNPRLNPESAAECLLVRAYIAVQSNDVEVSLRSATQALERYRKAERPSLPFEGLLLSAVGRGHQLMGHNAQANHYYELALQKFSDTGRERSLDASSVRNNWAAVSSSAGDPRRALELYDQTLKIMNESGVEGPATAVIVHNRARSLELLGRYAQARDSYALGLQYATQQRNLPPQALCLLGLASVAEQSGDRGLAEKYLNQLRELVGTSLPADSLLISRGAVIQAKLDLAAGKLDQAREQFKNVIGKKRRSGTTVFAELGKAELELRAGDALTAESDARAALDMATSLQGGVQYSNQTGMAWLMFGRALQARGDTDGARKAFATAVSHFSKTVDADHPEALQARKLLSETG